MGYCIEYSKDMKPKTAKRRWILPAIIGSIALLAVLEFSGLKAQIASFFLPGDPAVTASAFDGLVDSIRAGERASDAVTAFCQEILANAG